MKLLEKLRERELALRTLRPTKLQRVPIGHYFIAGVLQYCSRFFFGIYNHQFSGESDNMLGQIYDILSLLWCYYHMHVHMYTCGSVGQMKSRRNRGIV
ncbi:hypothetical protein EMCRGX_G033064 [Ephydatia muelleri]